MSVESVQFRKFPYPYRSMLAICSDLDETQDWPTYREISRYLNTSGETAIGPGVGLEVGNTLYFDMPAGELSYWNATDHEREQMRALIRSGHIDCFHSFGDDALQRMHAERALDDLEAHSCRMEVWVDHATAATNFGPDIMQGHGDEVGHSAYHADRTFAHGVRYVWLGRVTSVIGQDVRYNPLTVFDMGHAAASLRTMAKDVVKHVLSAYPTGKYSMHSGNRLTREVTLRSGHTATEFMRCNPHPGGVSVGDNAPGIAEALSDRNLDALVRRQGVSIIYTHLGKKLVPDTLFNDATRRAFERLAGYSSANAILVTSTRRLLGYHDALRQIDYRIERHGGSASLDLQLPPDLSADGITLYWEEEPPAVSLNGRPCRQVRMNSADETGRRSVSVPWPSMQWPL